MKGRNLITNIYFFMLFAFMFPSLVRIKLIKINILDMNIRIEIEITEYLKR
jgi:hypothetical protein